VAERTTERIQHNNQVFREANERIHAAAAEFDHELEKIPFLCECPVEDCVEIVRLTEEQYEAIRADPRHYMTAVGHEAAEAPIGQVVARNGGYVIVEKP
jgi:hypothetical protein